jgi:hypothetical protein
MTNEKKTVDTGTPPSNVLEKQRIQELIMSGESITPVDQIDSTPMPEPVVSDTPLVRTTKRVILNHSLYKLTLPVLDVSIAEHQVAVRLPDNGFKFEPKELNSEFSIEYLGKEYKVAYLGGIFDFPGDNSWVIAFIRVNNTND